MKFLILAACVAAASAQGFYGLQSVGNTIVPVDEPAVAAARADHLAAKGLVNGGVYAAAAPAFAAYNAAPAVSYATAAPLQPSVSYSVPRVSYAAAPVSYAAAPAVAYSGYAPSYGYAGPLNLNTQLVAHPNGAVVPVDEPAVAAARADHLATKGQLYSYAPAAPAISYAAAPVAVAAPAVSYAAAPVQAVSYAAAPINYGYAGPLNLNTQLVAHPNGAVVPVDEPAVAAARADHLATKFGGVYAQAAPAVYGAGYAAGYAGLQTFANGAIVPVDEPAVAAARADHFAALAAAY